MRKFTAITESPPENLKKLSKMSKSEINEAIMCAHPNGSLPNMRCVNRACKTCEMKPVELLQPLADYRDEMKWYVWEYEWLLKKGEKKRIMSCVEKTTTMAVSLESLQNDMKVYSSHIFWANWQHAQTGRSIIAVHPSEVVVLMDYSENYCYVFQNEIQIGFSDQAQVTIHPAVSYHLEDNNLVKHAIIGISEDTRHDAYLTKRFETGILNILRK